MPYTNPPLYFMSVLQDVMGHHDYTSVTATEAFDSWVTPHVRVIVPPDPTRPGVPCYVRLVVRPGGLHLGGDVREVNPRDLAYDLLTTLLSETTNNDACDVVIRERSAHLDAHPDLDGFHGEVFGTVIIDAVILDELS